MSERGPIETHRLWLASIRADHGLFWWSFYLLLTPLLLPYHELEYRLWDEELLDALVESKKWQESENHE